MIRMRNAYEVIKQIKEKVPKNIEYDLDWLEDIISSARYQPPESQWIWNEISNFVNDLIPYPPKEQWHKDIVKILTGKDYDE